MLLEGNICEKQKRVLNKRKEERRRQNREDGKKDRVDEGRLGVPCRS